MDSVFDELYRKYHRDLFQFLFYMVKNREEAEDLVQEVYIRVMKSYRYFKGESTEKTWLFSIAKNVAIDHFRKQKNWRERIYDKFDWDRGGIKDAAPLPEDITIQNENVEVLFHCLGMCSTNHKLVIIMRYINDFSVMETAQALNWSESKVKTTQHRAIKALRGKMETYLKRRFA
ncbi:RNA polymerase sigma factor SigX [Lederbergia sp. NSJ-179]|nr:RNA polymerase sigma factor SigX [Lederbergia sp. NSJ-179]